MSTTASPYRIDTRHPISSPNPAGDWFVVYDPDDDWERMYYLWRDDSWNKTATRNPRPRRDNPDDYPGYYATEQAAREALDKAIASGNVPPTEDHA